MELKVTRAAVIRACCTYLDRDHKILSSHPVSGEIRNEEIRGRTRVTDKAQLKWQCRAEPMDENRWTWMGLKVLVWRPPTGKRSVGRPPTRWIDDIRRVTGSRWSVTRACWRASEWGSARKSLNPRARRSVGIVGLRAPHERSNHGSGDDWSGWWRVTDGY
ncbi:jg15305 [Pararge aegeria aegeria]|uniref:Jg15305 protein n=1 Tax=Pararge aegeria aegeria TaxID=348720 RepID=A0A8S4R6S8_9NEOP|nr:jg15305 [Pararge aegeria aegeria]